MQRFCHRAGVGIVGWRQGATADAVATMAPRDNHRRIVTRGRHGRVVVGYAVAGATSVASDLAASYNVQGLVSTDLATAYNMRAAVVSDLGASYDVLSAGVVQSGLTATYNIRAAATAELNAVYTIDGDAFFAAQSRSRVGPIAMGFASRIGPQSLAAKTRIGEPAL